MPKRLEKVCLDCTLPLCNDRAADCKYVQITRSEKDAEAHLKEDIIAILGRLIGEKAVDEAKAKAKAIRNT